MNELFYTLWRDHRLTLNSVNIPRSTIKFKLAKDRPKVKISVSAETKSHAESGIRLLAETKITPKETIRFRPKSETETESACDLSSYPRVRMWT